MSKDELIYLLSITKDVKAITILVEAMKPYYTSQYPVDTNFKDVPF